MSIIGENVYSFVSVSLICRTDSSVSVEYRYDPHLGTSVRGLGLGK